MNKGTNRQERERAMRQESSWLWTRDIRGRFSSTKNSHAALQGLAPVTRAYQSDSSSKYSLAFAALGQQNKEKREYG
jgi:hypothetical protein